MVKKILDKLIPRYGLPSVIGSDNRLPFISKVTQNLVKAFRTNWKLYCAYHPQSSRQVERSSQTLKEALTKLTLETGGDWTALLHFSQFQVWNTPYYCQVTPYEITFGRPPPLVPRLPAEVRAKMSKYKFLNSIQAL